MSDSDWVIRVAGVTKVFPVYASPADRLKQFFLPRLVSSKSTRSRSYYKEFSALRDVNFDIKPGETVGIIGRNGAGKSTLLQIICGTLSPTSGSVLTRGRIAALLELGAGFNPEFSGRENVYLNGSILGMQRDEVDRRFDEIAAFADIGDFIDQPVKTYSSGMYVRLAFAVQACVEPDILIVDEALSVGDIGFQYKCFKRMESLREKGVTILMVTHSTGSVLEYADRCIVLDGGSVVKDTHDVLEAVLAYEKGMLATAMPVMHSEAKAGSSFDIESLRVRQIQGKNVLLGEKRFGSARAIIDKIVLHRPDGSEMPPVIRSGEEIIFRITVLASECIDDVVLGISLSKTQGGDIWGDNNLNAGIPLVLEPGETEINYRVRLPVSSGDYLLHCGMASLKGGAREELDQRRPLGKLNFWSPRAQVGVVHAPIQVVV